MNHDLAELSTCYTLTWKWQTAHGTDRVWRAITDPAEVSRWMGYPAEIDLTVGGRYWVNAGSTDEGDIAGTIVEIGTGQTLAYAWGLSVARWELTPAATGGASVTFLHHGLSRQKAEDYGAGWHDFYEQLWSYLDGGTPLDGAARSARFDALTKAYAAHVGQLVG